ncbi:glycosyltransferase [Jiangella mangrovi]|uniref:UDP:flavonoid glycosyltransferase YjiC (YdhE family) n=1 Tax=Jiangella mangrovi TaxID=1524084 RepID=A0A7W9GTF1_9ACTN|nr:nucleotide disphospho-sugar-binding domain-containing protein [Jiangella mangrovi]MBB5789429.1 UDP:flavonoid glycosyltransferase YjiC (YdhE family) [Jiangella mangrovi]
MSDILIASVPIHGHVTPLLGAAVGLVRRGHRVRFLTGARFASLVEETGSTFVALPADADYDDRQLDAVTKDRPRGLAGLRFDVRQIFLTPAPAQYRALLEQLAEPTKAVLVDPTFLGAFLLTGHPAHDRPPVIYGGVTVLTLASPHVPPFGLGLQPLAGPARRLNTARNRLLRFLVERVVFAPVQRDFDALYQAVHGRPAPAFVLNWVSTVDAIVQFSVPAFEYPQPDAAVPTYFSGPLTRPATAVDLPAWWDDLRTTTPVVLVTQGTIANADLTALVRPTLDGLAGEDVLVVVTTGGQPAEKLGPLPDNARVARFLPYDQLLPLVDVMVTNGGYGGVHYALTHGVPLVAAGVTEDKPEVCARVAWSGAGVNLRTGRPRARAVRRAVLGVLRSSSHRAAAGAIASQIAESRGVDELVDVIEDLDGRRTGDTIGR